MEYHAALLRLRSRRFAKGSARYASLLKFSLILPRQGRDRARGLYNGRDGAPERARTARWAAECEEERVESKMRIAVCDDEQVFCHFQSDESGPDHDSPAGRPIVDICFNAVGVCYIPQSKDAG